MSRTPLEEAVLDGDHEALRALLDEGGEPQRGNALFHAIEAGDLEMVRLLVEHGAAVDDCVHQKPMLVWATTLHGGRADQEEPYRVGDAIAEYLIDHGARVDYLDPDDCHALSWAVRRRGRIDLVQRLVEQGALRCLVEGKPRVSRLTRVVQVVVDGGDSEIEAWLLPEIEREARVAGLDFDPRVVAEEYRGRPTTAAAQAALPPAAPPAAARAALPPAAPPAAAQAALPPAAPSASGRPWSLSKWLPVGMFVLVILALVLVLWVFHEGG